MSNKHACDKEAVTGKVGGNRERESGRRGEETQRIWRRGGRESENKGRRGQGKEGTNTKEGEESEGGHGEGIRTRVANQEGWRQQKDFNKLRKGSNCLLQIY